MPASSDPPAVAADAPTAAGASPTTRANPPTPVDARADPADGARAPDPVAPPADFSPREAHDEDARAPDPTDAVAADAVPADAPANPPPADPVNAAEPPVEGDGDGDVAAGPVDPAAPVAARVSDASSGEPQTRRAAAAGDEAFASERPAPSPTDAAPDFPAGPSAPSSAPASAPASAYARGDRVLAYAGFDGAHHAAEVVALAADRRNGEPRYYVHYVDFNKRCDQWVTADQIRGLASDDDVAGSNPGGGGFADGAEGDDGDADVKLTRNRKRKMNEINHVERAVEDLPPLERAIEREHEEKTKVKNVETLEMGRYEMDCWYYSPFPEEFSAGSKMYACEYCLKYARKRKTLLRHKGKCPMRHPPGNEIYRQPEGGPDQPQLSVFEVDGARAGVYCQNLCLVSKLFLDHKTLYYDVDPFLFYVLTEKDDKGHHVVGYFSKEKYTVEGYNLACILTLPPYQRKGYGKFLIAFSYELSKREGRAGTPERPLSDLGQVSYRGYWTRAILTTMWEHRGKITVADISRVTAIAADDIVSTLQSHNMLRYYRGSYIVSVSPHALREATAAWCPELLTASRGAKGTDGGKGTVGAGEADAAGASADAGACEAGEAGADATANAAAARGAARERLPGEPYERGKVYVEFLDWQPDPDRAPVRPLRRNKQLQFGGG